MKKEHIILFALIIIFLCIALFLKIYPVNLHICERMTDSIICNDYTQFFTLKDVVINKFNWTVEKQITNSSNQQFTANQFYVLYYLIGLAIMIILYIFLVRNIFEK